MIGMYRARTRNLGKGRVVWEDRLMSKPRMTIEIPGFGKVVVPSAKLDG
jgi:hypothetical protein